MSASTPQESEVHRLRSLNQAQARLVTAVQDLSLARSLQAIQETVRRAAREIAGADGATFVLRHGDQCHYADEDAIAPLWKGQEFPMTACVSGWAMLHRRAAVISDVFADERVPADAYRPTFVKSLVMVPIRLAAPIGAIGVYWSTPRLAAPEEVELLQALANTTAVAMENVQVHGELEQRVARRTQELEDLNRELEAFSYSVSHDLRAPLRAISGFTSILEAELGSTANPEAQRCLKTVQAAAERMDRLIADLLKLARLSRQEIRRSETDLAEYARMILRRLKTESPGRSVEVVIPATLKAECDPGLMAVVLENLLGNAWKYTGKTASPRIELGAETGPEGEQRFYVRDNGAGFDPRYVDRLFVPFQRLHSADEFPGNGIGLATAQRILRRHGGRIWAVAAPGQGATFTFTCPPGPATATSAPGPSAG